jgi:hypothetical protein
MYNTLYSLEIDDTFSTVWNDWNIIKTNNRVSFLSGLVNYGFGITNKGVVVIYGGLVENARIANGVNGRGVRYLNVREDMWIFNISREQTGFEFVNFYFPSKGGFSKLIPLGDERLCLFNTYLNDKLIILNFEEMKSYPIRISPNAESLINRTAFGITALNETSFLIFGGYDQSNSSVNSLEKKDFLRILTFTKENNIEITGGVVGTGNVIVSSLLITTIGSILGVFLISIVVSVYLKRKREIYLNNKFELKKPNIPNKPIDKLSNPTEIREAEEENIRSVQMCEVRGETTTTTNTATSNSTKTRKTATLVNNTFDAIYVPGYKLVNFDDDFMLERKLASGGFGAVYFGKVINMDIANSYNNGNRDCVIKIAIRQIPEAMFFSS